jgi:hypothetical protein
MTRSGPLTGGCVTLVSDSWEISDFAVNRLMLRVFDLPRPSPTLWVQLS